MSLIKTITIGGTTYDISGDYNNLDNKPDLSTYALKTYYATSSTPGLIMASRGIAVDSYGEPSCTTYTKSAYSSDMSSRYFIGKGTFENLKTTTITSSSDDVGYATPKAVYDLPTTYTGYDATKTQVLKNINGVLTWVDEE